MIISPALNVPTRELADSPKTGGRDRYRILVGGVTLHRRCQAGGVPSTTGAEEAHMEQLSGSTALRRIDGCNGRERDRCRR